MEEKNQKINKAHRPKWDEFWLMQALFYSTRGTCDRLRTAAVIIDKNNRLISAGYNGSAPGSPHCDDVGHFMADGHCFRTLHAEDNALLHNANVLRGATAYLIISPCVNCMKKLISSGVKRIVYAKEFKNVQAQDKGWGFINELASGADAKIEHVGIDFQGTLDNMIQILEGPGGALRKD